MPSFLAISTCLSAQDTNAPIAQIVITCHSPPSLSGAKPSPYSIAGGAMLMRHTFQVGPIAAP